MAITAPEPSHRRRRRQDKPSISARLVLDDHVRRDVGIISEDLFGELFPLDDSTISDARHIAIAPWTPSTATEDARWTVVPVTPSSALAHSTVQFSPSSLALQSFAELLRKISPSKLLSHSRSGIEIRVLDVAPLPLQTVFVTLGAELAARLENGEGTFHGEHPTNGVKRSRASSIPEQRVVAALRESLARMHILHAGDFFPLPLPPHPITHVPPPPAKIMLCEPVAQGTLRPDTNIIVTRTGHRTRKAPSIQLPVDDGEDTANDQFFSAAEDRYKTEGVEEETATETESETDDLSEDSMDDMISLQAPLLPSSTMSGVSTVQPGSPHTVGLGRRANGIHTPGSVFSTFTSATVRASGAKGRLFKTQGLTGHIPEISLFPKPHPEEDDEVRIYVDTNSLTKIGCFSGDWVRVETAAAPPPGVGLWGLGSFGAEPDDPLWRPAKVYSLPEGYSHRPVSKIPRDQTNGRKLSFFESQVERPSHAAVFLSPLLLANLESSAYVRISPLKAIMPDRPLAKVKSSAQPPVARELVLHKVATPLSTERQLQNILFARLQQYFKERTRIVRKGDLVGIGIDETLAHNMHQANDAVSDDLSHGVTGKPTAVSWFLVDHVSADEDETWAGIAAIDVGTTRMTQSGTAKLKLPGAMDSFWEYYLGVKTCPPSANYLSHVTLEPRRPFLTPTRRRLRELITAATSPRAIHLKLPPVAILLVSTQRNIGKATIARRAAADVGVNTFSIDAYDILSEGAGGSDVKTEALLKVRAERAMSCGAKFCALLIQHVEALTADRMVPALQEILSTCRVLMATTTDVDKMPDAIRGLFTHELELAAPDESEREGILQGIVDDYGESVAPDVDLGAVAVKTAALVAGDLLDVVDRAIVARRARLEDLARSVSDYPVTARDVQLSGGASAQCLTAADFTLAVDAARKNFADAIGAPKIPNVTWDDVGGLSHVKDAVMETIQLPLERPELFAKGMKKRSGILFYGPPGTGKTLLAKAIATEFSLNFFSVKGPELLNMYIGESEANVRRVFQRARDARPCVVFFDELDSVAPKRGNQGDSGGVMDRIVSQLLAELDGMGDDGGGGVFVIGATNRPDLLDAALLRPGRFDKMLYLGVSDTHEKQLTIMEALTRKFTLHPATSLKRVAAQLPFTYTGADFYALCSDAMLKAITRAATVVDGKIATINASRVHPISTAYFFDHFATKEDIEVQVTEQDFLEANRELVPSVSAKELEHYHRVRQQFERADPKPERKAKGKGKGKAVDMSFDDGPEEDLYG